MPRHAVEKAEKTRERHARHARHAPVEVEDEASTALGYLWEIP